MAEKKGFDRSKFKGAKVAANKASVEEASKKNESDRGGRAGYHKIDSGKNVFRIAPPHNEDDPALEPICKVWLPREITNKDGKKEVKNMPIFNAKHHCAVKMDIVDEYIDFAMKVTYKELSKDEAKKKLAPITGYKDKQGKWVSGIKPSLSWDAYAWKGEEFGRLNLSKTIVDRMNELSIDEESEDPISVDPFSDPDNGVSLIVEYDPNADSSKKYKINKGSKVRRLEDEQLEELSKAESLASMLRNQYTMEDFRNSLAGLQIFDEKNGFGFMEMEEFVEIIERVQEALESSPDVRESNKEEEEEDDDKKKKAAPVKSVSKAPVKQSKPVIEDDKDEETEEEEEEETEEEETEEEESEDGFDELSLPELKEYIEENDLPIVVKDAYPKTKVIKMLREHIASAKVDPLPFEVKDEGGKKGDKTGEKKESYKEKMERLKKAAGKNN